MEERALPRGTASILVPQDNGEPLGADSVRWAVDALSDGYDFPSLRILAGLDLGQLPNSFEAGALVEAALNELAVPGEDRDARARRYVREVCAEMLDGRLNPLSGVELIHRRVITPLKHPADLMAWCYLSEGNSAGNDLHKSRRSDLIERGGSWTDT
jgi:hypothetical protein